MPPSVTKIGKAAFRKAYSLKRVEISPNTSIINERCFEYCCRLKEISIPQSVTIIKEYAFKNCESLEKINLPSSVTTLEQGLFKYCNSLEIVDGSFNVLCDECFNECKSLKKINSKSNLTDIGNKVFKNCSSLEELPSLEGITRIGNHAFCDCSSLKSIKIVSLSFTVINKRAFCKCESLESITIPSSVTTIDSGAFHGCSSLKSIIIPSSVTSIGNNAFNGCSALKSIEIPSSIKYIGKNAFLDCNSIELFTIPTSIDKFDSFPIKCKIKFYNPNQIQNDESNSHPNIKDEQCTFIYTGKEMKYQKLFRCYTCKLKYGECICEVCAKKCHDKHDVHFDGFKEGFCDCGAGNISCHCICCDKNAKGTVPAFIPGPCTINRFGEEFLTQNFFRCRTCNYSYDSGCCTICAKTCHLGHELVFMGYIPSYCDCGHHDENCKCVKVLNPNYKAPQ